MAVSWIIADVDGCISPEESVAWELDELYEVAAISRAASTGQAQVAPMTFCTGRPQPYVEVLMKLFDTRAPAICENGAVLYTLHDNYARFGPGVTEDKLHGLRLVRELLETKLLPEQPAAVLQFGKEAQISVFSQTPEVFGWFEAAIRSFVTERGLPPLVITTSHYYLNISLQGVDKGSTLSALLNELGCGKDDVAGIGDTEGDLPLRERVGFFACPANATEEIKAAADYVSPHPTAKGVLDILGRREMGRG